MMKRACLVFGLVLAACSGGEDGSENQTPDTGPASATLLVGVPTENTVAPTCPSPQVWLYVNGAKLFCPVESVVEGNDGSDIAFMLCDESQRLRTGVSYQMEVVYLQGTTIIARGALTSEPMTLQRGRNSLRLPLDNVTTSLDANSNGTADIQEACP